MHKFWTEHYPDSVPASINPDSYENITEFFEECFERYRLNNMSICMGVHHSYDDIDRASIAIGAWLQAKNIPQGSIIALMMPNVPQYLPTMIGILRAGYICTPINPLYTGRELKHQLNDSEAETIFLLDNFAQALEQVVDETKIQRIIVSKMGDLMGIKGSLVNFMTKRVKKLVPKYQLESPGRKLYKFADILRQGRNLALYQQPMSSDRTAILQYTGGTTGLSKGAVLTQRNIISAALQAEAWSLPATRQINQIYINMVMALPLYHIFAFMMALLGMRAGYTFILIPNPRDMPGLVKTLSKQPFHVFPGVNTLFKGLLDQPNISSIDFSHLKVTQAGGMAATEQTAKRWLEVTGCPMMEGWGMTEGVAVGTANIVTDQEFNGTIGLPLPSVEFVVRDEDDKDVGVHQSGELCIRGPNVSSGYYKQDSSEYFTHDGYFRTGDIVSTDERGYITLLDRKKDMILVSGFNVFPNEVEEVILDCPNVVNCAAIGIPDERQGEAVKLYVVRSNDRLKEWMIKDFASQHLTGYKCPRFIEFIDDLPKSNVGKVLRQKLREKHFADHG